MVEGYFDFAQAYQAGICNVVASSGTALTPAQARLLKRFASKVVLSFDPDAAGQGAAARSSELLVAEGFQVNVAMLPAGDDPDNFIRKAGRGGVPGKTAHFRPYLDYLLDRTAAGHDFSNGRQPARVPERHAGGRGARFRMLRHVTSLPTGWRIKRGLRKRLCGRRSGRRPSSARYPWRSGNYRPSGQVKPAERGLIWAILRDPADRSRPPWRSLEDGDLDGLATQGILEQARSLQGGRSSPYLGRSSSV